MKKLLLILLPMLSLQGAAQVLQDGSFENWSQTPLFERLDWWNTSSEEGLINNATKSTDAAEGLYALRIETQVFEDDTVFGFALYGEFGDEGPEQGLPFLSPADTIKGSYKYNIAPGDTGIILVAFTLGGNIESMDVFPITGEQNSWSEFAFPLSVGTAARDSVIIAVASSNALAEINITPGSWVMIDDIHFSSSITSNVDEVRNGDFEDWSEVVLEDLTEWSTYNEQTAPLGEQTVKKVSGDQNGTFAARLETVEFFFEDGNSDTLPGIVTNGILLDSGVVVPQPYTGPLEGRVSGKYKFSPAGPSTSAFLAITFYKDGNMIGEEGMEFDSFTPLFEEFAFEYSLAIQPDSFEIIAYSGELPGNAFTLDDLAISDVTSVSDNFSLNNNLTVKLYPNPAKEVLYFEFSRHLSKTNNLVIFDVLGNEVGSHTLKSKTPVQKINVSALSEGIYFYQLKDERDKIVTTGKFNKF